MSGCASDAALTALLEGKLPASEAIALREHTLECPTCGPRLDALESAGPSQRERLGRYVLLGVLGEGGMGRVLRAYDPQLDRRCALKLVKAERASPEAAARLVREAQAMAKLQHPNIVTVFDAGENDGEVFVAMELVEGPSFADWLKSARPWREVVERFCEAGLGLQAAHDAGLVHRDFKPANVLLRDGVAKVTDFGLARGAARDVLPHPEPSPRGRGDVTLPGLVMGTPAYMAPEQRRGEADARTDQYAFGVSLFEALHGRKPNDSATATDRQPPRWLDAICRRLLEEEPSRRFPSMRAVVDALRGGVTRRQNRIRGALVLSVATLLVGALVFERSNRTSQCEGAASQLDARWNSTARAALQGHFAAAPWAREEGVRFEHRLDAWAQRWAGARTGACIASRIRGELSDQLYGLESLCLERRLGQFEAIQHAALSVTFSEPKKTLERLAALTSELPDLDDCADADALLRQTGFETEVEQRAALPHRARLDEALSLSASGLDAKGLALANEVATQVTDSKNLALRAETMWVQGQLELRAGTNARAKVLLLDAWKLAIVAHADDVALRAWLDLIPLVAVDVVSLELVKSVADASMDRVGRTPAREAAVLYRSGRARFLLGDYEGAARDFSRSWELRKTALGPDELDTLNTATNVAASLVRIGRSEEAIEIQRQVYEAMKSVHGPESVLTLEARSDYASQLVAARRDAEAQPLLEEALRRLDADRAADSLTLYSIIDNLAFSTMRLGDLPRARSLRDRLVTLTSEHFGPGTYLADAYMWRAELDLHDGRIADALADARAAADGLRAVAKDHDELGWALSYLAEAAALSGDLLTARKALDEAVPLLGKELDEMGAQVRLTQACVLRPSPAAAEAARAAVEWMEKQPHYDFELALARRRLEAAQRPWVKGQPLPCSW
ncbi:MAG: serine/threonine protein kinase [Archangium sp.]|nr:serine/threonine protein kinase [Archangium sp.]